MSLVADTEILLDGGIFTQIQDVVEGDEVVTRYGSKSVLRVFNDGEQPVYLLTTKDGSVRCTGDHGWLCSIKEAYDVSDKYGWFAIEDLKVGDSLFLYPEKYGAAEMPSTILSIELIGEALVYDLEIEHTNEYIANGFISHNFS